MNTRRDGHRTLSDGRKVVKFECKVCKKNWTANHANPSKIDGGQLVKESLERASVRILSRRHGHGKKQIMATIHQVTSEVKDSVWIANHFPLRWSGVLVVDGKYVKSYDRLTKQLKGKWSDKILQAMNRKVWICGIDYETGDLPHYQLAEEESKIELVMYFKTLKEIGYPLRVLVCDGNVDIPSAARHVFGDEIIVQLCTRHFVEGLKVKAGVLFEHPRIRNLIFLIQRIIEADDLETAGRYLEQLKQLPRLMKLEKELIATFKRHAEKLTAHLLHPKISIPHTSNDIESLFKQLGLRLETVSRFNQWQYAAHYLKAWALLRRFTPFTDCRNGRRWRNGKAPIEIAGADIKNIDCLKL